MSACITPSLGTPERLIQDFATSDETLCHRIASMIRDLAKPGAKVHASVHIDGEAISVKLEAPPHRWLWDGSKMRRQG